RGRYGGGGGGAARADGPERVAAVAVPELSGRSHPARLRGLLPTAAGRLRAGPGEAAGHVGAGDRRPGHRSGRGHPARCPRSAAGEPDHRPDRLRGLAAGAVAAVLLIGIVFILVFARGLHALPSGGTGTPAHMVLPAITLAM